MATPMHILIVEDDEGVRDTLATALRAEGYRVSMAAGSVVAVRDLVKVGDPVDAILLGGLLPGEDGGSVASFAREVGLPVLVISGSDLAMKLSGESGRQLLRKPPRTADLRDALDQAFVAISF